MIEAIGEIVEIVETAMVVTATETEIACQTAMEIGTVIASVTVIAIDTAVVAERTLDASDPVRMTAMMTIAPEDDTKRFSRPFSFCYGPLPPSLLSPDFAGGYP